MTFKVDEEKVKFMFLRAYGRVLTIARQYNKETNEVLYAYSLCCPKDQFSRRIGRMIAMNRMNEGLCSSRPCGDDRAIDVSIRAIAEEVGFVEREGYVSPSRIARYELIKRAAVSA